MLSLLLVVGLYFARKLTFPGDEAEPAQISE